MTATAPSTELHERFQKLAAAWRQRSRFMSNTAQMATLEQYQKIIGMGPVAIPWILEELRTQPGQWFWALEMIADCNPVPFEDRGDVGKMTEIWLQWGRDNGYIV